MGLLIFSINVTLDGCVDHQEGVADDETHAFFTRLLDESGAMLWGRVTYEMMESYWPAVARGDEATPPALREWAVKAAQHQTARAGLGAAAPKRRRRHALPARADLDELHRVQGHEKLVQRLELLGQRTGGAGGDGLV